MSFENRTRLFYAQKRTQPVINFKIVLKLDQSETNKKNGYQLKTQYIFFRVSSKSNLRWMQTTLKKENCRLAVSNRITKKKIIRLFNYLPVSFAKLYRNGWTVRILLVLLDTDYAEYDLLDTKNKN